MTPLSRYDAIVVGARAAGAATAMLLARQGLRVLAVDRSQYGSDTLSTHALMRTGVVQLNRWGLLDRVKHAGSPAITQVTFHYPDETVTMPIRASGEVDALYAPRRTVLDPLLADAAWDAGAHIHFGVVVDGLLRDDSGRVTGIVAHDDERRVFEVTADIVIGADGIRSFVAKGVGAETIQRAAHGSAAVYAYFDGVAASGYEWAYAPGLGAGLIPTNNGQTCVFVGGDEAHFRQRVFPDLQRGFDAVLEQVSPDLARRVGDGSRVASYRGFAGVRGYFRRCVGAGWALVGDAGYFKDPITQHGISDALRDAELLARAIAGEISMQQYQEFRNALSADLFAVTERIAAYDWTMDDLKTHLMDLSKAMKAELTCLDELQRKSAA